MNSNMAPTTTTTTLDIESLVLHKPPPLDPAWLQYEREAGLPSVRPKAVPLERQPVYAHECRALHARMMAPGARDFHLSQGVETCMFTVPSSLDGAAIPVLRYDLSEGEAGTGAEAEGENSGPKIVVIYYHGGGLYVGEADSEDLSCRRILKEAKLGGNNKNKKNMTLFSVGYRLMPLHPASTCVSDSLDAFLAVRALFPPSSTKIVLVGSSSGGQLAALVSQAAVARHGGGVHGVLLRCPVTSDAFSGAEYVPARLRRLHTSAWDMAFRTSLLGVMTRDPPRDGLPRMPLEAAADDEDDEDDDDDDDDDGEDEDKTAEKKKKKEGEGGGLRGQPRTWIQVCSNDMLYSDGICYAKALQDAGVPVRVDVVRGWPHTFWLKAPQLPRALEADRAMLDGLAWVVGE